MTDEQESRGVNLASVSSLCHELRKPISAIKAFSDILADELSGTLNASQHDQVETILRNSERMDELVRELYEFAEVGAGGLPLEFGPVELEELCAELQDELTPRFLDRGVRLQLVSARPVVHARLDRARLRSVLTRLLLFALRGSEDSGTVTLGLEEAAGGPRLELNFDGARARATDLESVFSLDGLFEGETIRDGGLGVGMHVSRATVEAMGGRLSAERCFEGGLRFVLELPPCDG